MDVTETYEQIIENIYTTATARIHLEKHVSEDFKLQRGTRQGGPIPFKLIKTVIEDFRRADIQNCITE